MRTPAQATREVISAYVGQLTEGCGNATCDEVLCATGRRNLSGRRQRDYTARSARTIAITLASGPKPRARLCPWYKSNPASETPKPDARQDSSAWSQIFSDTDIVRTLCSRRGVPGAIASPDLAQKNHTVRLHSPKVEADLARMYLELDEFSIDKRTRPKSGSSDQHPTELATKFLHECIKYLTSIVPLHLLETDWVRTNRWIGEGHAYVPHTDAASRSADSGGVSLMEYINYEPSLRVFRKMIEITAKRHELRYSFTVQRANEELEVENFMVIILLRKVFVDYWDGDPIIARNPHRDTVDIASESLMILGNVATFVSRLSRACFPIPAVAERVDAMALVRSFKENLQVRQGLHVLEAGSILPNNDEAIYFRHFNHLRMREAHSNTHRNNESITRNHGAFLHDAEPDPRLGYLKEHYLVLTVSRGNVLEDTFDQLWHRHRAELLRPLRVRLGEVEGYEIGQDLGGVQIEFFNLICKELMEEDLGLFTTDVNTGFSYFVPGSLQPLHKYELCGLLIGLAVHNGIAIPVSFPLPYYDEFKGMDEFTSVSDAWPTTLQSLESVLKGEVSGLDYVFPMEANGLRLSVLPSALHDPSEPDEDREMEVFEVTRISKDPGCSLGPVDVEGLSWPGWRMVQAKPAPVEVDETNRQHFFSHYILWLIRGSVAPQWEAFKKGFFTVIDRDSLRILSTETFRNVVEGSTHLDINELRKATQYEEPYTDSTPYINSFWQLVNSWPAEKQKQLVKFVTAAERIPAGGAERLTFKIQGSMSESVDELPTSSTCFGILTLPEYPDMETLDRKLSLALEFGLEGFGTG